MSNVLDVKFHSTSYNAVQATASAQKVRQPKSRAGAERAKATRHRNLRHALPAMRALYDAGVSDASHTECVRLYTLASVELAHLNDLLGERDADLIDEIADLFIECRQRVDAIWHAAAIELEADLGVRTQAAHRELDATRSAFVAHRPLFDMADASRAFLKTKERDEELFGRKPLGPVVINKDGRPHRRKTERIYTGMPNIKPETGTTVRGVPDGPGAGRFTRSERKALRAKLGVEIDTLRRHEREDTPEEFAAWFEKRLAFMADIAKREAEKAARGKGRKRKPGKMAAIRAYMEFTGYSRSYTFKKLKDLTTDQILARIQKPKLVYIGGSDGPATVTDETDKEPVHPAFPSDAAASETRDTDPVRSPDETDKETDKNGPYPAKSVSFTPDDTSECAAVYVPFPSPAPVQHAATMAALRANARAARAEWGQLQSERDGLLMDDEWPGSIFAMVAAA